MIHHPRTLAVFVPAIFLSLSVSAAALPIKPGLWESTSRVQAADGQFAGALAALQQQMGSMSPEQRKSIEGMIASNGGGFTLPTVSSNGDVVTKVCLTPEMIENSQLPTPANQYGCTHTSSPVVGATLNTSFSCTNPAAKGQARFVAQNDKAYTMTMDSTATINGAAERMKVQGSGRWLGADCGSVKPTGVAK